MKRLSAKDIDFVRRIMTDESVYPFIIDDGSPPPDEFPVELFLGNEKVFVLSPNDGSVFLFVPIRHRVYEVHTCVLPGYRGLTAIQSGKAVVYWMFANTDASKIFSIIPENNRAARMFALRCGFRKEGEQCKAWSHQGKMINTIIVGIER